MALHANLPIFALALLLLTIVATAFARRQRNRTVNMPEPQLIPVATPMLPELPPEHSTQDPAVAAITGDSEASISDGERICDDLKEENEMGNTLSQEELDTLLGEPKHAIPATLAPLHDAAEAALTALDAILGGKQKWSTTDAIITSNHSIATTLGLPVDTTLLVVETRVPGGLAYIATSTITACRIDELAQAGNADLVHDEAFSAWRYVVESMVGQFYQTLLSQQQPVAVYPSAMQPRRWDPTKGGLGLGLQRQGNMIVQPFHCAEHSSDIYLLLPEASLTELTDESARADAAAATLVADQPSAESRDLPMQLVGDIPLSIAVTTETGRLPIRSIANWRNGELVPINLQPGQAVDLLVNGRLLAKGRLVLASDGSISAQIIALLPLTADAG